MPHCNFKVSFHLWYIRDSFHTGVGSIVTDVIHEHAHIGVVAKSTVYVFPQSIGNKVLALMQVQKLLEGESYLLPIIRETTQLELKFRGHVTDILKT